MSVLLSHSHFLYNIYAWEEGIALTCKKTPTLYVLCAGHTLKFAACMCQGFWWTVHCWWSCFRWPALELHFGLAPSDAHIRLNLMQTMWVGLCQLLYEQLAVCISGSSFLCLPFPMSFSFYSFSCKVSVFAASRRGCTAQKSCLLFENEQKKKGMREGKRERRRKEREKEGRKEWTKDLSCWCISFDMFLTGLTPCPWYMALQVLKLSLHLLREIMCHRCWSLWPTSFSPFVFFSFLMVGSAHASGVYCILMVTFLNWHLHCMFE